MNQDPYEGLSQGQLNAMTPTQIERLKRLDARFAAAVEKVQRGKRVQKRQAAEQVAEQFEIQEQAGVALNSFIAEGGDEVAPYFSGSVAYANSKALTEWSIENLPYAHRSMLHPDAFHIAFRNLKAGLPKDPRWLSGAQIRSTFDKLYTALSSAQLRAIYENRLAEFEKNYAPLSEKLADDLAAIGGPAGFKAFVDEGMKSQ